MTIDTAAGPDLGEGPWGPGPQASHQKDAGRGGLVVGRPTAVREDPGSDLTAAGRVYHDSHCDIQPWARVVHPYCSA